MSDEEHITRVQYQDKEIILIATAHVSKASAEALFVNQPEAVLPDIQSFLR